MKRYLLLVTLLNLPLSSLWAQAVNWAEIQDIAPPLNGYEPREPSIVSDGLDLVSAGTITDTINFGNQVFAGNYYHNSYLAKHSSNGTLVWAKHLVGATDLVVTTDVNKNIFITGRYADSLHIGNLIFSPAGNSMRFFVAKFTPQGSLLWARHVSTGYQAPNLHSPNFHREIAVTTDGSGNVYAAAQYSQTFTAGTVTFNAIGSGSVFLLKYDANGTFQWAKNSGTTPFDGFPALVGGIGNDVYLATILSGTSSPGSPGQRGYFLRKFDVNGIEQWAKFAANLDINGPVYLARDASENIYMAARTKAPVLFGNHLVSMPAGKTVGAFLVKVSASGAWKWAKQVPGTSAEYFSRMASQTKNQLDIISYSINPYSFILGKLDTAGAILNTFVINYPSTFYTHRFSVTESVTDDFGNTYFAGLLAGSINLGAVTLNAPPPVLGMSPEPSSTFIAKIQANISGLNEEVPGLKLILYPNPAKNYVMVAAELKKPSVATIRLVNVLGQVISEVNLPANSQLNYQLPLNNMPKGVYMVQLETENGQQTQRLVVQ